MTELQVLQEISSTLDTIEFIAGFIMGLIILKIVLGR